MKILAICVLLLSVSSAFAATQKLDLICKRAEDTSEIRLETTSILGSSDHSDDGTTVVTRVQQRPDDDVEFVTYAVNKDITETGSLESLDLKFTAVSKKKKAPGACYSKGTELHVKFKSKIGGHGHGAVYLMEVQSFPSIKLIDNDPPCAIPKVMPGKAYGVSCKVDVED
jgi:hypothetical protein